MRKPLTRAGWIALLVVFGLRWVAAQAPATNADRDGDNPRARAAAFMSMRRSVDNLTPAEHRERALEQRRNMPTFAPRVRATGGADAPLATTFGGGWTPIGPQPEQDSEYGPLAGRITAIAADLVKDPSGNTVYIGAAYGGLWESTNALSANPTFTAIGDTLPTLAVGSIALDASTTPTTIYVGTGEPNLSGDSYYGVGVVKSTDGGQTWSTPSREFYGTAVTKVLVDPTNPQALLMALTYSGDYETQNSAPGVPQPDELGLFQSLDGGNTWTAVQFSSGPAYTPILCTDLIYDAPSNTYYVALDASGIYESVGPIGHSEWTPVTAPFPTTPQNFLRASLAMRAGVLYALIVDDYGEPVSVANGDCSGANCAGLLATSNGGAAWTPIALPANVFGEQGWYDQYIAAPAGSSELIVGGIDTWLTLQAQGASTSWSNLTRGYSGGPVHPDEHAIVVYDPAHWVVGNDGGVWSTANAGATWSNLNSTISAIQFYSVTPDPATAGRFLGGSQDNGTALTTLNQLSWPEIWGGDGGHTAMNPSNTQQLFTEEILGGGLYRSDDGGASFHDVIDGDTITDPEAGYPPYALAPGNTGTVYLITNRVWRGPASPATAGAGWSPISGVLTAPYTDLSYDEDELTAIAIAPSAPDTIYVGAYDGSLWVTNNASAATPQWTQLPVTSPSQVPIASLTVSSTDPNTVYVGLGGVGLATNLMYSQNGLETWSPVGGGLPAVPVNATVADPDASGVIYVATDVGVFVTSDGGGHWFSMGSVLPPVTVLDLELTEAGGVKTLVAGTHGRGAWTIPAMAPANFSISVAPTSLTVEAQQPAVFTIQTTAVYSQGDISFSCSTGISCTFSPATVAAGGSTQMTVDTSSLSGESANITVSATNGYYEESIPVSVALVDFEFYPIVNNPSVEETGQVLSGTVYVSTSANAVAGSPAFEDAVTLSCPNAPVGITCTFTPDSVAADSSATATVQIAFGNDAVGGVNQITLQAAGGATVHSYSFSQKVQHFTLAVAPATQTIAANTTATLTVSDNTLSGFTGVATLSCSGTLGATCTFQPAQIAPGQTSTLTLSNITASEVGLTVTGTYGTEAVNAGATVDVATFGMQSQGNVEQLLGAGSVSFTESVFGLNGFQGTVTLSCGANPTMQCGFSPAVLNTGQTSVVTVTGLPQTAGETEVTLAGADSGIEITSQVPIYLEDFTVQASPQTQPILPYENVLAYPGVQGSPSGAEGYFDFPVTFSCVCSHSGSNLTFTNVAGVGGTPTLLPITATATNGGVTLAHTFNMPVSVVDFSLQATNASASVNAGQTASYAITISPSPAGSQGSHAMLEISCSGLPAGASCLTNAFISAYGTSFTLYVPTAASASTAGPRGDSVGGLCGVALWSGSAFSLLVAVLLLGGGRMRRHIFGSIALAILLGAIACGGGNGGGGSNSGGGGGSSGSGGSGGSGTTPVTTPYTFTVAATDGTSGLQNPDSHSIALQLNITQ